MTRTQSSNKRLLDATSFDTISIGPISLTVNYHAAPYCPATLDPFLLHVHFSLRIETFESVSAQFSSIPQVDNGRTLSRQRVLNGQFLQISRGRRLEYEHGAAFKAVSDVIAGLGD